MQELLPLLQLSKSLPITLEDHPQTQFPPRTKVNGVLNLGVPLIAVKPQTNTVVPLLELRPVIQRVLLYCTVVKNPLVV